MGKCVVMDDKKEIYSISKNRENKFIDEQSKIVDVDDNVIKSLIKYDKFISLITNPVILDYLDNRYKDSSSIVETVQRIRNGAEIKPKCPVCGNPTTWVGRKRSLFTKYCSNPSCYNSSSETKEKKRISLKLHEEENKKRMVDRFGVEYNSQRKEQIEKRKATLIEKYGTMNLHSVQEFEDKSKETIMKKTGYDSYFKIPEIRKLAYEQLLEDSKSGKSKKEDEVYVFLIDLGYIDTIRHYISDSYPYPCDFYIPSLNMYIEYHGSQYHNGRAYLGTSEDIKEANTLLEKDKLRCEETGKNKSPYFSIFNTWANIDCKRRNLVNERKLKYLELYSCDSKEELKFQIDMLNFAWNIDEYTPGEITPDMLNECDEYSVPKYELNTSVGNKHSTVKFYQFGKFFKNEMHLYAHDVVSRRKLIQNRMKYLNKKERDLTFWDLVNGFKKSGICYGYSHFNPDWVNWFCVKYNIKRMYDPCGGWGHHILGMQNCDKIYYNDINFDIMNNVRNMCSNISKLKDKVEFSNDDARVNDIPEDADGVFMCPPYYNLEDYGNAPFKDMKEYNEFLKIIFGKWKLSSAKVFGIIIPESYVGAFDMQSIESYVVNEKTSHLIEGKKKTSEVFYIFVKGI